MSKDPITEEFCKACRAHAAELREMGEKRELLATANLRAYIDQKFAELKSTITIAVTVTGVFLTVMNLALRLVGK